MPILSLQNIMDKGCIFGGNMCGRFAQYTNIKNLINIYLIDEYYSKLNPGYNIAPGSLINAIILNNYKRKLIELKWGLIPQWLKDAKYNNVIINARAESIHDKASFKKSIRNKRCLVIADGYYEWKKEGNEKQPVYIKLKSGSSFVFAGIYETFISQKGEQINTCAIITTEPNEKIKKIHNRMPVIIPQDMIGLWLNPDNSIEEINNYFKSYPSEEMEYYRVSKLVNSTKNNTQECINPIH